MIALYYYIQLIKGRLREDGRREPAPALEVNFREKAAGRAPTIAVIFTGVVPFLRKTSTISFRYNTQIIQNKSRSDSRSGFSIFSGASM